MSLRGPVLVAIDFSDFADEALRQGHAIATAIGAPLIAGHVIPEAYRVRMLFPHQAGVDSAEQSALDEKARAATRDRVDTVLGATSGCTVEIESGTPHAGIRDLAERLGAALIVTGPGPTAQRVARASMANVLVARHRDQGPVLGATDFSDPSLPAVHMAAAEATRRGVALHVIHCLDVDPTWNLAPLAPGMIAPAPLPQEVLAQFEANAREQIASALTTARAQGTAMVAFRPSGHGIVEAADEIRASLVVVGTHGRTGLSRLALGSVAEYVMGHAGCSVLTVPLA